MNKEISVGQAAALRAGDDPTWSTSSTTPARAALRAGDDPVVFLDVREHNELALCRIEGALHIPMAEVPGRKDALPRDRPLVVFCHHGMRSASVVAYLRESGFDRAVNLTGGIDAWSVEVDPAVPRY